MVAWRRFLSSDRNLIQDPIEAPLSETLKKKTSFISNFDSELQKGSCKAVAKLCGVSFEGTSRLIPSTRRSGDPLL